MFGLPKLVNYLRILGYDTLYVKDDYQKAIELARSEGRILISQVNILPKLPWVLYLTEKKNDLRLKEIFHVLKLHIKEDDIYSRCGACNTPLYDMTPKEVDEILPNNLKKCEYHFKRCPNCGKIYWKGEHYLTLKNKLSSLGIMNNSNYRLFDHTADLGIEVEALSLEGIFESLGKAIFSEMIKGEIEPKKSCKIRLFASSKEALLVKWVNELLYRFEVEGIVFSKFSCRTLDNGIECLCFGEEYDEKKHEIKMEIKAATYHNIFLGRRKDKWIGRIILDI